MERQPTGTGDLSRDGVQILNSVRWWITSDEASPEGKHRIYGWLRWSTPNRPIAKGEYVLWAIERMLRIDLIDVDINKGQAVFKGEYSLPKQEVPR